MGETESLEHPRPLVSGRRKSWTGNDGVTVEPRGNPLCREVRPWQLTAGTPHMSSLSFWRIA